MNWMTKAIRKLAKEAINERNKSAFINPPKYPSCPISAIGWFGYASFCPNCDTRIKNNDLRYCEKCHFIYGEENPRNKVERIFNIRLKA